MWQTAPALIELDAKFNATDDTVRPNVGIRTGNGVVVVDLDGADGSVWRNRMATEHGAEWLNTLTVSTGSGGSHLYYTLNAQLPNSASIIHRGVDIRGDGGFVVGPGSTSGRGHYDIDKDLPMLPLPAWVLTAIEEGRARKTQEAAAQRATLRDLGGVVRVKTSFGIFGASSNGYCIAGIEGKLGELAAMDRNWRPGAGWDVNTFAGACRIIELANEAGMDPAQFFDPFMGSAPFNNVWDEREKCWRSAMKHIGDKGAVIPDRTPVTPITAIENEGVTQITDDVPPSRWEIIDVEALLSSGLDVIEPTIMARTDGHCLLYPGMTHSLAGPPGSGKSFTAQWVASKVILDGKKVLYIDYESHPTVVFRRLRELGCSDASLRRVAYINPTGPPGATGFEELLTPDTWTLCIIDGVTAALNMAGLAGDNISNSGEATMRWHNLLPERIAASTGAAVLQIDHVTKSKEGRGGYAIGSGMKLAAITGAAYILSPIEKFGKGKPGTASLYVAKDRLGEVEGATNGESNETGTHVGQIYTEPHEAGGISMTIRPPSGDTADDRVSTELRNKIVTFLGTLPEEHSGLPLTALRTQCGGKAEKYPELLDRLVADRLLIRDTPLRTTLYRLTRPEDLGQ